MAPESLCRRQGLRLVVGWFVREVPVEHAQIFRHVRCDLLDDCDQLVRYGPAEEFPLYFFQPTLINQEQLELQLLLSARDPCVQADRCVLIDLGHYVPHDLLEFLYYDAQQFELLIYFLVWQ